MAAYKLTGMHSHRHPFLGVEEEMMLPSVPTNAIEALAEDAAAAPATTFSWSKVARPLLSGGVTGLITYATCRSFGVDKKQARQVSFVLAGINALVGIASDWIYGEMQSLVKSTGAQVTESKT